jgi:hypothetical protein
VGDQFVVPVVDHVALLAPLHVYVTADAGTALATRIAAVAHAAHVRPCERVFESLI